MGPRTPYHRRVHALSSQVTRYPYSGIFKSSRPSGVTKDKSQKGIYDGLTRRHSGRVPGRCSGGGRVGGTSVITTPWEDLGRTWPARASLALVTQELAS